MDLELTNQIVLVTGSSRGLGQGIAEGFLSQGARVILSGRDERLLEKVGRDLRGRYGHDRVLAFAGDLRSSKTVSELVGFIREKTKNLDHLICSIGSGRSVPPLQEDVEEFRRMLEVNLLTAVGVMNHCLPLLQEGAAGGGSCRSIIFIGSICGMEAIGCPIAYASAKAALESYAKNISKYLGQKGIRVNIVTPGNIMFPGSTWERKTAENPEKVEGMLKKEVALQRFGTISDVADVVVFLASRRANFVTGANWVVDGGQVRS